MLRQHRPGAGIRYCTGDRPLMRNGRVAESEQKARETRPLAGYVPMRGNSETLPLAFASRSRLAILAQASLSLHHAEDGFH